MFNIVAEKLRYQSNWRLVGAPEPGWTSWARDKSFVLDGIRTSDRLACDVVTLPVILTAVMSTSVG